MRRWWTILGLVALAACAVVACDAASSPARASQAPATARAALTPSLTRGVGSAEIPSWPSAYVFGLNGGLVGGFAPATALSTSVLAAAGDGSRLLLATGAVVDRFGSRIATLKLWPPTGLLAEVWSADDTHLCAVTPDSAVTMGAKGIIGPVALTLVSLDGTSRRIAALGADTQMSETQTVVACDVQADRAVVIGDRGALQTLRVMRLSTGTVVFTEAFTAGTRLESVAPDGAYLAEGEFDARGREVTGEAVRLSVRALPSGRVVAEVGSGDLVGFSGDDRLVVIGGGCPASCFGRLVDWSSGRVVWSAGLGPADVAFLRGRPDVLIRAFDPVHRGLATIRVGIDGVPHDLLTGSLRLFPCVPLPSC